VLRPGGAFPCRGATFLLRVEQESQKRCRATALKRKHFRVLRLDGAFPCRGATFLLRVEQESQKRCQATALKRRHFRVLRLDGAFPRRGATLLSRVERASQKRRHSMAPPHFLPPSFPRRRESRTRRWIPATRKTTTSKLRMTTRTPGT
jgi:hypothetical protein